MTTRSTSASTASALISGASPAKRAAVALDRTISDPMPGERRRDGVRQAERQEVGLRIGTQDAEGQHDDARQRLCQRASAVAVRAAHGTQFVGHRLGRAGRSAGFLASARRITRSTAATAGEPLSAGGCSDSVAWRTSTIVRPAERRPPGQHLEQDRAGCEEIAARIDRLARDLLGRHVARRAHHEAGRASGPSRDSASPPAPGARGRNRGA